MIGFFDSGFGGLTILKEVEKLLPQYSYIYLGDNARTPYGSRSDEVIFSYTVEGLIELFNRGASLIILACNTSSAVALRKIQQEWLPVHFPDKKVLGIIIPTAEEINHFTKSNVVGILATEATIRSNVYTDEIFKINSKINVVGQACPLFVPTIEAGEHLAFEFNLIIRKYLEVLIKNAPGIDAVILGCTHYAIIESQIRKLLPKNIRLITQGEIVAKKLKQYLARHNELEQALDRERKRVFLTTKDSEKVKRLTELFYGKPIKLELVKLSKD